jgi:CTP synthase
MLCFIGHPYFVGFQAHPEFCTRPLNPSPPFLGFVAAASGVEVLQEQIDNQLQTFAPPHPPDAMRSEAELKRLGATGTANGTEVIVNGSP